MAAAKGSSTQPSVITGNDADNNLFGLAGNDTLIGNGGNDWLDGGMGADALIGGAGDDTYVVDNAGDTITELAGEGADTVQTSLSTTLADNLENLSFTGTLNLNGTGNSADNVIIGNAGNNTLLGLAGDDRVYGGQGATRPPGTKVPNTRYPVFASVEARVWKQAA